MLQTKFTQFGAESQAPATEIEERFQVRDARSSERFYIDNRLIDQAGRTPVEFLWRGQVVKEKLGADGIAVYAALCRHADWQEQTCFPSHRLLAEELGIGKDTVGRAIAKLEALNIIKVERNPQRVNRYYLLDKSQWQLSSLSERDSEKLVDPAADLGEGIPCPWERGRGKPSMEGSSGSCPRLKDTLSPPQGHPVPKVRTEHNTLTKHIDETHHGAAFATHDGLSESGPSADDGDFESKMRAALRALGHDQPRKLITQALKRGWSEKGLARAIEAVARANGKIKDKPAFITSLLEWGPDQAWSILKSYSVASDQTGTDVERLKRQYKALIVERGELLLFLKEEPLRQDFQRRLAELEEEGRAIAAELREAGVDPEEVKAEVYHHGQAQR